MNINHRSYAHMNNDNVSDSDDDIADELDFETKTAVSSPKKKFSQKYIEKNRNQLIMRHQDIFDQSTKAANDINDDGFSPQLLDDLDDSSFMIERRGSKYAQNINANGSFAQRKRTSSYTSPIDRKQSVSSTHSYSMKKEFGARRTNKKRKNMLTKLMKWTKD